MENRKYIDELYELYSDEIHHGIISETEYNKVTCKIASDFEKLYTTLTKKQQNLINIIIDEYSERNSILSKHSFKFGYSLATKLITEGLQDNKNIDK